jgi:hypothetical protein
MNEYGNQGFLKRNVVWLVVLFAVVIFGLLLFNGWDKIVNETVDNMTTITGNFSCLPFKDESRSSETNCTLGVKARDGSYYALDISRIQDANTDLKAEDTIAVTGVLLPATEVPGTEWEDFNVQGIVKVNTLLRTK